MNWQDRIRADFAADSLNRSPHLAEFVQKHGRAVVLVQLAQNAKDATAWGKRASAKSVRDARKLAMRDAIANPNPTFRIRVAEGEESGALWDIYGDGKVSAKRRTEAQAEAQAVLDAMLCAV